MDSGCTHGYDKGIYGTDGPRPITIYSPCPYVALDGYTTYVMNIAKEAEYLTGVTSIEIVGEKDVKTRVTGAFLLATDSIMTLFGHALVILGCISLILRLAVISQITSVGTVDLCMVT